jgi:general secretion pathway protein H
MNCRFKHKNPLRQPGYILSSAAGFTLIELIIVITIMTVVLGMAPLYFAKMLPSARLKATAGDIASTIKTARSMALFKGRDETVTLDMDRRWYGIQGRGGKDIPEGIELVVIDPFYGEIGKGTYNFTFGGAGQTQGGSLILKRGKRSVTIDIDPVVGAAVVSAGR